jgi:hypothetical protein
LVIHDVERIKHQILPIKKKKIVNSLIVAKKRDQGHTRGGEFPPTATRLLLFPEVVLGDLLLFTSNLSKIISTSNVFIKHFYEVHETHPPLLKNL